MNSLSTVLFTVRKKIFLFYPLIKKSPKIIDYWNFSLSTAIMSLGRSNSASSATLKAIRRPRPLKIGLASNNAANRMSAAIELSSVEDIIGKQLVTTMQFKLAMKFTLLFGYQPPFLNVQYNFHCQ